MKLKRRLVFIHLTLVAVIIIGFIIVGVMVNRRNNEFYLVNQDFTSEETQENEFYCMFEISKSWAEGNNDAIGAQYDAVICNATKYSLDSWKVEIDVPYDVYIDSSWDGAFKIEGTTLTVTALDYNQQISSGCTGGFGWVMKTPKHFNVQHCTIYARYLTGVTDYPLFWVMATLSALYIVFLIITISYLYNEKSFLKKQKQNHEIIVQSLITFANFIDAKDSYTKGHSSRVAAYSREIIRRLENDDEKAEEIYYIALLHDVGKIAIADAILNKPGALSAEERRVIETHTVKGGEILKDYTALSGIGDGAMYHHERYDGDGYPTGKKGLEIPFCARVICIADSYDAMSSDRCYRKRLSVDVIVSELERCKGTQFDPKLVEIMIEMIKDGTAERIEGVTNAALSHTYSEATSDK